MENLRTSCGCGRIGEITHLGKSLVGHPVIRCSGHNRFPGPGKHCTCRHLSKMCSIHGHIGPSGVLRAQTQDNPRGFTHIRINVSDDKSLDRIIGVDLPDSGLTGLALMNAPGGPEEAECVNRDVRPIFRRT